MIKKILATISAVCLLSAAAACNGNTGNVSSGSADLSAENPLSSESTQLPSESSQLPAESSSFQSSDNSQSGNNYTSEELEILTKAANVINWQLDNGGWGKNYDTTAEFTGFPSDYCWSVGGKFVGTIDNGATFGEMRLLAQAYNISGEKKFKDSFDKAMAFLNNLQYPTGGFAQIYPHNGKYNDYVTFNDNAMINVIKLLKEIAENKAPFENIADESQKQNCANMVDKAIEYILNAQINVKGEKAGWCAQHNPVTYAPEGARNYELPSVSGCESVGIIQFLLTQTDNAQALSAAEAARKWLVAHRIDNVKYSKKNPPLFFTPSNGDYCWYRFYSLDEGVGFFCTRAGVTYYDINEFYSADSERATGYDWAGNWLQKAGLNY